MVICCMEPCDDKILTNWFFVVSSVKHKFKAALCHNLNAVIPGAHTNNQMLV